MKRPLVICLTIVAFAGLAGCAAAARAPQAEQPAIAGLPGLTEYYQQATEPHRRAVRKPVRDQRERALRTLARRADVLLAETESWASDARLVALAETEQPAAREAVAAFRGSLRELKTAATRSDVAAVRREYGHVLTSYRHLNELIGPLN